MGLDEEDTPVGAIIALVLITITVFIIIVLTFESCSEFAYDRNYQLCADVKLEIIARLGEDNPCYDSEGNAKFSYRNIGSFPFEGMNIKHEEYNINISAYVPELSRGDIKINLGLERGQTFRPINVSPIVYFEELDYDIICERSLQRIRRLERCTSD